MWFTGDNFDLANDAQMIRQNMFNKFSAYFETVINVLKKKEQHVLTNPLFGSDKLTYWNEKIIETKITLLTYAHQLAEDNNDRYGHYFSEIFTILLKQIRYLVSISSMS